MKHLWLNLNPEYLSKGGFILEWSIDHDLLVLQIYRSLTVTRRPESTTNQSRLQCGPRNYHDHEEKVR